MNLTSRQEAPDYFTGREFRRYDFALGGTVYAGSAELSEVSPAHALIMEVLAQVIAARLKTRTTSRCELDSSCHFYRPTPVTKRKKGIAVIDERAKHRNTSLGSLPANYELSPVAREPSFSL